MIRYRKNIRIVPDQAAGPVPSDELLKSAVVVNLYYPESLEWCLSRLMRLPDGPSLYLITSNENILERLGAFAAGRERTFVIKKDNRGRDLSALLTAFAPYSADYEYICFLHDKSAKSFNRPEDIEFWMENLWSNTIGSTGYISNILEILKSGEAGLVVPPPPAGYGIDAPYTNTWYGNYDVTVNLLKDLGVSVLPDRDVSPATLGTAFWCRRDALKKLFDRQWDYDDFPQEPMPIDGTTSHALERSLSYIAKDAGYETLIAVCPEYAMKWGELDSLVITDLLDFVKEYHGFSSVWDMKRTLNAVDETVVPFAQKYRRIYIYGAGADGHRLLGLLQHKKILPAGFIVSDGRKGSVSDAELPVYELSEVIDKENSGDFGILLAANSRHRREIEEELVRRGVKDYLVPETHFL